MIIQEKLTEESFHKRNGVRRQPDSLSEDEMDEFNSNDVSVLSSMPDEVSDEEVSTQKDKHWRLGPEDLEDTVVFEFEMS